MEIFEGIFDAITNRNLEYLDLRFIPEILETPSEDQIANLQHYFTKFLKNQAPSLKYFHFAFDF